MIAVEIKYAQNWVRTNSLEMDSLCKQAEKEAMPTSTVTNLFGCS